MNGLTFLLLGVVCASNFCIILAKYRMKRYFDTVVDACILTVICVLFSGTFGALVVGTIASACVSLYLWFRPFTIRQLVPDFDGDDDDDYDD